MRKRTENRFAEVGIAILAILMSLVFVGFLSSVIENNHRGDNDEPEAPTESPVVVARRESLKTVEETFVTFDMTSITAEHATELCCFRNNAVAGIRTSGDVSDIRVIAENFVIESVRQYKRYYASDFRDILLSDFDSYYRSDVKPLGDFANYTSNKYEDMRYRLKYKVSFTELSRELLESYKAELYDYAGYIEKNYIFGSHDNVVGAWELR